MKTIEAGFEEENVYQYLVYCNIAIFQFKQLKLPGKSHIWTSVFNENGRTSYPETKSCLKKIFEK